MTPNSCCLSVLVQVHKLLLLFRPINLQPQEAPPPKYAKDRYPAPPSRYVEDRRPLPPARYIEERLPPPAVHLPPREDAYRTVSHVAPIESIQQVPAPGNDPYAHYARASRGIEARHAPATVLPQNDPYYPAPSNDPYYPVSLTDPYQVETRRAYHGENPIPSERYVLYCFQLILDICTWVVLGLDVLLGDGNRPAIHQNISWLDVVLAADSVKM